MECVAALCTDVLMGTKIHCARFYAYFSLGSVCCLLGRTTPGEFLEGLVYRGFREVIHVVTHDFLRQAKCNFQNMALCVTRCKESFHLRIFYVTSVSNHGKGHFM